MSFKDFIKAPKPKKRRGRPPLYKTEEERMAARRESQRKWLEKNPDYHRKYYEEHKNETSS